MIVATLDTPLPLEDFPQIVRDLEKKHGTDLRITDRFGHLLVIKGQMPELRCGCARCDRKVFDALEDLGIDTFGYSRFYLCPDCGNKRCPRASWHTYICNRSNEPGQVGVETPPIDKEQSR